MSREYFAHNFTIPMPLIQGELKLHKKKEPFERIERFNAGDLFSCENQCNMSNIKQQIKLSNGRYQCECLDGFVGPCCNQSLEPSDLFSCENQCNMSNIKQQIKLSNGRYQCECLDGFVGPCCNVKFPPDPPPNAKDPCSNHDHPTTCDGIFNASGDCRWNRTKNQCESKVPICESDGRQHFGTDHCGLMPAMIVPPGTNPRDPHTPAAQIAAGVCKSVYSNPLVGDAHVCRFDPRQKTRTVKKDGKNVKVWMCSNGSKCNPP